MSRTVVVGLLTAVVTATSESIGLVHGCMAAIVIGVGCTASYLGIVASAASKKLSRPEYSAVQPAVFPAIIDKPPRRFLENRCHGPRWGC